MLARYIFIALGIISLLWVGYVAADLIDQKNTFAPTNIFGKEDGKVLILNRIKETEIEGYPFNTIPKNQEIIQLFKPLIKGMNGLLVSASRRVILIETSTDWSKNAVNEILKKTGRKFKSIGMRSFEMSGYIIEYYKNVLYLHSANLKTTKNDTWGDYDRKSSVVIVDFTEENPSVFEVYLRGEGKVEFITKNLTNLKGKQVDDKSIFSNGIPQNAKKYHFIQKDYAMNTDGTFSMGPMRKWVDKGFVSFQFKGKDAIVTDILPGKSPLDILNSINPAEEEHEDHGFFKGAKLSEQFPKSQDKGFHVFIEGNFCILTEEEWVGSDIVGQLKLKNTLSAEQYSLNDIYSDLPARVSERFIDGSKRYTKTVYKSKLLETHFGDGIFENLNVVKEPVVKEPKETDKSEESTTYNINAKIVDFVSFDGKGNFVTMTQTGELMSYSGGRMNWVKNLNAKVVGGIMHNEEYNLILVTTKSAIHLVDKTGKYVYGGPISIGSNTPTQCATMFNFKGRLYIAYPDNSGNVIVYDSKRKKLSKFPHGLKDVSQPVDIWVSREKLFFGILNNSAFTMLEAETKEIYRSVPLTAESVSAVWDNELFLLTSSRGSLNCINQKGLKFDIRPMSKGKMRASDKGTKFPYLSNCSNGQIVFFGSKGAFIGKIKTTVTNPDYWVLQTLKGLTYVSLVDDLDNNTYIYELDGGKIVDRSFEGSKKCQLSNSGESLLLTTVIDKFIVQYLIK